MSGCIDSFTGTLVEVHRQSFLFYTLPSPDFLELWQLSTQLLNEHRQNAFIGRYPTFEFSLSLLAIPNVRANLGQFGTDLHIYASLSCFST